MRTLTSFIALSLLLLFQGAPASAQGMSPEAIAVGFVEGVVLCARAKSAGGGIASLAEADRAVVTVASDDARRFVNVTDASVPVWEPRENGRGVVVIVERTASDCEVTAYGPRVRPVFDRVASALRDAELGFAEREVRQDPSAILREFVAESASGSVLVRLDGGEPGMPGRTFRFPLLIANVTRQAVGQQ